MWFDGEYIPHNINEDLYNIINETGATIQVDEATGKTCSIDEVMKRVLNSIPGENYKEKLEYLSKCNCCERHKKNKPVKFEKWIELPVNNTEEKTCPCECRHVARFICRQHPDY
tara:strand:+ start:228 stop:569 length:342 start_codon:yes stop_codon:yes gene_type:complete